MSVRRHTWKSHRLNTFRFVIPFIIDTRQSRPWIHGSFPSTSVIAASSQSTARTAATSDSTDTQATAVAKPSKKKQQHVIPHDRQHAALERLVADLTLSVPVVLLLSLYYPVSTASWH